jgi:hypothetical protein
LTTQASSTRPTPDPLHGRVQRGIQAHRGALDARILTSEDDELTHEFGHLPQLGGNAGQQCLALVRGQGPAASLAANEQVHVGPQAGERGAQLVSGISDELRLPGASLGEGGDHGVEGVCEPGNLVVSMTRWDLDLDVEILGARHVLDGSGEPAKRAQPGACHDQAEARAAKAPTMLSRNRMPRSRRSTSWVASRLRAVMMA